MNTYIFGPVLSRRLGRSLGVDMIPLKTCNCNCVYCECGAATPIADIRKEYVSSEKIIKELDEFLRKNPQIDYVTFGGSGEPTLNSGLGKVIRFVKDNFPLYKTALLTNSTLLYLSEVREEIAPVDLVLPSLDAVSEENFRKINRPHYSVDVNKIIEGLIKFSYEYKGKIWIEVFIVPGINDTDEELKILKETLLKIRLDRVQLNSLDRPGACSWVKPAEPQLLLKIANFFSPLPVEIISRKAIENMPPVKENLNLENTILHQLQRRPATIEELSIMCGANINILKSYLDRLISEKKIKINYTNNTTFFALFKKTEE
ncbi:MAG: radical SAM protein [Chitinispirillaceae bacterium]|nr:radical SAM protein [Chitinispirillaceae bacterium]